MDYDDCLFAGSPATPHIMSLVIAVADPAPGWTGTLEVAVRMDEVLTELFSPRAAAWTVSVVSYVVKAKTQKSRPQKSGENRKNPPETNGFKRICGGRYKTRTCDLPHVNAGMELFCVIYSAF